MHTGARDRQHPACGDIAAYRLLRTALLRVIARRRGVSRLTHVPVQLKVVAYIVKADRLVAFLHEADTNPVLQSGLQVPAGTVDQGEELDAAVLREAREETGLEGLRVVRYLGCDHPHWPGAQPQERHFFHLEVDHAPDEWRHVEDDGGTSSVSHPFRLFWLPIEQAALLAAGQGMFAARLNG